MKCSILLKESWLVPASGSITEPVTVEEFKNYARISGFQDDDASGEQDFTSDDALIQEMITSSREAIEQFTGWAIVAQERGVRFRGGTGEMWLPFSNGAEIDSVTDCNNNAVTGYTTTHGLFKYISGVYVDNATVLYTAPGQCPARLKQAILIEALYRYENRGDLQPHSMSKAAIDAAWTFKQTESWLA